ncbi:hypothetical protein M569_08894, partial [Genlisea aurea]
INRNENDVVNPSDRLPFPGVAAVLKYFLGVGRRRWRMLFLLLSLPFLVPLLCVTCPLVLAVEICAVVCRKRRRK